MDTNKLRFETKQIHGGYHIDATGSRGIAIHPTAAYHFKNCDHAARLFELSESGNIYTRLQNPTTTAYEERIAALYNGVGALSVASGMSAILITVTSLASAGDNIVASPFLYGGTYNQFRISLRKLGIECRIAKSEAPRRVRNIDRRPYPIALCRKHGKPYLPCARSGRLRRIGKTHRYTLSHRQYIRSRRILVQSVRLGCSYRSGFGNEMD